MSRARRTSRQSSKGSETEDAGSALLRFANAVVEGRKKQTAVDYLNSPSSGGTPTFPVLSYFPSALFATILEDTIMKMRTLIECSTESSLNKVMVDMEKHMRYKYGVAEPQFTDELDMIGNKRLDSDEFKMYKMDKDRTIFTDVMCATYLDLALRLNYKSLTDKNNEIVNFKKSYLLLKDDEFKNKVLIREVRKQLRQLSNQNKAIMYDANAVLDKLQKTIEDSELTQETEKRYLGKWEHARTEQHIHVIKGRENISNKSIRQYRDRMEKEQIVHSEIDTLVNIAINETMAEVQNWIAKYEKDVEAMDLQIQVKRNEYELMLEKREEIDKLIELHEKEMFDWNEFKRKRAEAQKYHEDMTRCAIIVQAWWRGLLVRKQLGPYKERKRRGGARKKK